MATAKKAAAKKTATKKVVKKAPQKKRPVRNEDPDSISAYRRKKVAQEQQRLEKAAQMSKILEMRKAGMTYERIGSEMGMSQQNVHGLVMTYLKQMQAEPRDELRTLHFERYNFMLSRLWPAVINGDVSAIRTSLDVMGKVEKLYALEAPVRTENVNVNIDPTKMQIGGGEEEYVKGMAEMAATITPELLARVPPHLREIIEVKEVDSKSEDE